MSKGWDVESYKTEHENIEHWELRKQFMLAHKDKFTEDELVCLAQVFTNIEFLGCRYPAQTMIRVAELAKGVVEQYREKRKNSLKRTFVAASDAASAKMKGLNNKGQDCEPAAKVKKLNSSQVHETFKDDKNKTIEKAESSEVSTRFIKYGGVKTFNINSKPDKKLIIGTTKKILENFVLFLTIGEHPIHDLTRSAAINSVIPRWEFEEGVGCLKVCKLYFNDHLIASGVGENMKCSKENTAIAAIRKLRESYFAIQIKCKFSSGTVVSSSQINAQNVDSGQQPAAEIGEDNVGRKLMKLMGWGGGGLGVKEQGIEEPIEAAYQVQRRGFGHIENDTNLSKFRDNATEYIKKWMNSESDKDLVFSTEFNHGERKVIHEVAKKFMLKSRSYGKDLNRHLVITRKIEPWELVENLKKMGGASEKYELLYPIKGG